MAQEWPFRKVQKSSPGWIIALLAVSTLTQCQLAYRRGSSTQNSHIPNRFYLQDSEVKQPSAEPNVRPQGAVAVTCHADAMEVVVQADLFGTGLPVDGRHLHLGSGAVSTGSACRAFPSGEDEFTIQTHLMDCGTHLSSTNEQLIYSNILVYSPEPSSDGVLRLDGAAIPVECHYERRYAVDGIALHPTWAPFVSTATAEDQIDFNLRLMTDDWQFERGSQVYFLGDPIHIEVSVIMGNHKPLRVYVDHCVATSTPDAEATLRYEFIEHYGCLADSYLTSSSSHFLPRVQEHKLRFQLDAFRFYQESTNLIYITCYVKAAPAMLAVSPQNRACSFIENKWQSVDGNDQACRSCDISQRFKEPQSPEPSISTATTWPAATPRDRPKQHPANYFRIHPRSRQNWPKKTSSAGVMKRGAERTKAACLGPLVILPSSEVVTKPTASTTVSPDEQHHLRLNTTAESVLGQKHEISSLLSSKPADTLTGTPEDRKHKYS